MDSIVPEDGIQKQIEEIQSTFQSKDYNKCVQIIEKIEPKIKGCSTPPLFVDLKRYYQLCGDVYSNLRNKERALEYYKRFHFAVYQIKNPYKEKGIVLRSFRPVSVYSLSDLINSEITLCSPMKMNDPFDSIAMLWSSPENLERLSTGARETHEFFFHSFNDFRIRSFTKNSIRSQKNNLMWSHYADGHKGFCVEYKFSPEFAFHRNEESQSFSLINDVKYSNDNDSILKSTEIDTKTAFLSKSKCWKYENEVRIVSFNQNYRNDFEHIPLNNSIISKIYFGYRCNDDNIRIIRKILGEKVKYYKMVQADGKIYSLRPMRLR